MKSLSMIAIPLFCFATGKTSAFSIMMGTEHKPNSSGVSIPTGSPSSSQVPSRRSFVSQVAKSAGLVVPAASIGIFSNVDVHSLYCTCEDCIKLDHGTNCNCGSCSAIMNHSSNCNCERCFRFGPSPVMAYERDVGNDGRSADTYAMNLQARETNARLEASGFKLDTKEEEAARLNEAFASFSYESTTSGKQNRSSVGKGNDRSTSKKTSK